MEKFCTSCGASYEEGTRFCGNCGAALTEADATPAATTNPAETIKKFAKFILIGFALIALILAVLNFGSFYDVTATVSINGQSISNSMPVKNLYEQDMFVIVAIGNYTNAVLMLLTAAVAIFGVLKGFDVTSISDKFIKSKKDCKELCLTGLLGTIAMGIQIFFYLLTGVNETSAIGLTATVSIAAPWFSWVALVLFVAVIVIDKVLINKKK